MKAYALIEYLMRHEQLTVKVLDAKGLLQDIKPEVISSVGARVILLTTADHPVITESNDPAQAELPIRKGSGAAIVD